MFRLVCISLTIFYSLSVVGQNKDTLEVSLWNESQTHQVYSLKSGTFSHRGTLTFFDMTPWDSSPYQESHLSFNDTPTIEANARFVMNYRFLLPQGYDAQYGEGYPLMLVFHDDNLSGNCKGGDCASTACFYSNACWDPNTIPPVASDSRLLNNDLQLLTGGLSFFEARNLAGSLKPDAPSLNPRAFPGFVVFPQSHNGWSDQNVADALRIVRLMMQAYHIDPNKVYLTGMGTGGRAALKALKLCDWLVAGAAIMSPPDPDTALPSQHYDSAINVPLWIFQGEHDSHPQVAATREFASTFAQAGGKIRYTLYSNTGHAVWTRAFNEPDFFSWFLNQDKRRIYAYFDNPDICSETSIGPSLVLPQGFSAYEWERNGVLLNQATQNKLTASQPGVYRARFGSKNGNTIVWNRWSLPLKVSEQNLTLPVIQTLTTTHMPTVVDQAIVTLKAEKGYAKYYWFRDGVRVNAQNDTLSILTLATAANTGSWTLKVGSLNNCMSRASKPVRVFLDINSYPTSIPKPTGLSFRILSSSSLALSWSDASDLERYYEVWRRTLADPTWRLAGRTDENATGFYDNKIVAGTQYWYKVRAISNDAASVFAPGASKTDPAESFIVNVAPESIAPSTPKNLVATLTDLHAVTLSWSPPEHGSAIKEYQVFYGSNILNTYSDKTSYTVYNVPINSLINFKVRAVDFAGNISQSSNQAVVSTFITGLFYQQTNAIYTNASVPDIRMVAWPSYAVFAAPFPQNARTAIPVMGTSGVYSGQFNNPLGNAVLNQSIQIKRNGNLHARVDSNGKIIRLSDQALIGEADVLSPSGQFTFKESSTGTYTIDYTWSFVPEQKGRAANFSLAESPSGPVTQDDGFVIEYDGYLLINAGGNYAFQVVSNDAALLYIDGNLVTSDFTGDANNSTIETTTTTNTAINLSSGPHRITVRFMEYAQTQRLEVKYRGTTAGLDAGTSFVQIPDAALRSYSSFSGPNAITPPTALSVTSGSLTQSTLSWTYTGALNIVVLGSSTATGANATPPHSQNGWVGRFFTWLKTVIPSSTLTNLGSGGYSTNYGLPTGTHPQADPERNITRAMSLYPDFLLVNYPTNDVSGDIPNATTMANYATLKAIADARGVPMFVATTQPRNFSNASQRQRLLTQANSIRTMFGTKVIDILEELSDATYNIEPVYNSGDGIHLNDAGHIYIYNTARDLISPQLQGMTTFEVHRATSASGPFVQVATVTGRNFTDTNLQPSQTYYYKIRTVTVNGTSNFSNTGNITTLPDNVPPSTPDGLSISPSYAGAYVQWNQVSDNHRLKHYEIFVNGEKTGTSPAPMYHLQNLSPSTQYAVRVQAVDETGNRSALSSEVLFTTKALTLYYSKASGSLTNLSAWGTSEDGSGTIPPSFSEDGRSYVLKNRGSFTLDAPWAVDGSTSKVIVSENTELRLNNRLSARVELRPQSKLVANSDELPLLGQLAQNSTIEFLNQVTIPTHIYGNVVLSGTGTKVFQSGVTDIAGNLTIGDDISLRGYPDNSSTLRLAGNLKVLGTAGYTPPEFCVKLHFNHTNTQRIESEGDVYANAVNTIAQELIFTGSENPVSLRVGSSNGGGLSLGSNSVLHLGKNKLVVSGSATINSIGETGKLAFDGGSIDFSSESSLNSNLYFHSTSHIVEHFKQNQRGPGKMFIRSPVKIVKGLKVSSGELVSDGFVTLASTPAATANLEQIEGNGKITGAIRVQRYLEGKGRMYRYLSSPVEGTTVADWQAFFPITGTFTGGSPGFTNNPSMYEYNEPAGGWVPYPHPQGDNQAPIQKGKGYSSFLRNGDAPMTMEVSGNPYQGDVQFPLTPDPSASSNDGWNLLGNPYASAISWANNGWGKAGVNLTVSVRENPQGRFRYYFYDPATGAGVGNLAGGRIASGQAFWVQSISTSPSLTIRESAKVATDATMYRESATINHFAIAASTGTQSDEAYVIVADTGTEDFDPDIDAAKRLNDGINLSTLSIEGLSLAINHIGNNFCELEIPLHLKTTTIGAHSFSFQNLDALEEVGSITLKDGYADIDTDVKPGSTYSFEVTADTTSQGKNRFKLILTKMKRLLIEVKGDTLRTGESGNLQWFKDGVAIDGATTNLLVTTIPGLYSVILKDGTCEISSDTVQMHVTSIGYKPDHLKVTIHPNPVTGKTIHVSCDSGFGPLGQISITDMSGKVLYQNRFDVASPFEITIDQELPPGTYLVCVQNHSRKVIKRIAVLK